MPEQVLAVSVVHEGDNPAAPPISDILGPICPDLNRRVVGNKAFLEIPDYEIFENFFRNCLEAKKRQLPDLSSKFYLALAEGLDYLEASTRAQDLLNAIVPNNAKISDDVLSYISNEIYEQLPPMYRDNYHSSTAMQGNIKAHRRFSEGGFDCFVVSPIGSGKAAVRERADFVFERYIKPACEATNYRARRSDMIISPTISTEMKKRLEITDGGSVPQ